MVGIREKKDLAEPKKWITEFPHKTREKFYDFLVLTHDFKVLYFFGYGAGEIDYADVTEEFIIEKNLTNNE